MVVMNYPDSIYGKHIETIPSGRKTEDIPDLDYAIHSNPSTFLHSDFWLKLNLIFAHEAHQFFAGKPHICKNFSQLT